MASKRIDASALLGPRQSAASPGAPTAAPGPRMITVKTERLLPNPHNPRDEVGDLSDLSTIVKIQQQSLLVVTRAAYLNLYPGEAELTRRVDYIVVNGCRRQLAAVKYRRPNLFCVVDDSVARSRMALKRAAYDENVRRRDFDAIEDAKAVMAIVAEYPSQTKAAEGEGWSDGYISQRKALLTLHPEVQKAAVGMPLRELRRFATKSVRMLAVDDQLRALEEFREGGKSPEHSNGGPATGTPADPGSSVSDPSTVELDSASESGEREVFTAVKTNGAAAPAAPAAAAAEASPTTAPSPGQTTPEGLAEPDGAPSAQPGNTPESEIFTAVKTDSAVRDVPTPRESGTRPQAAPATAGASAAAQGPDARDIENVVVWICRNFMPAEARKISSMVVTRLEELERRAAEELERRAGEAPVG